MEGKTTGWKRAVRQVNHNNDEVMQQSTSPFLSIFSIRCSMTYTRTGSFILSFKTLVTLQVTLRQIKRKSERLPDKEKSGWVRICS